MKEKIDNSKNHSEKHDSTLGYDLLLHGVSDEIAMAHVTGIHLPKQFKVIGMGTGATAETLHHSTGHLAEDIVCNAGVGLLKEFVDVSVARTLAGTVGASFSAVPMIAIPTTTALAIAAYRGMQKITEPAADTLRDICHKTFESLRETKVVENLNDLDEFIRGVKYLTSEYKWPNSHDLLLKPNVKDNNGNTPLHYAIQKNQLNIVKLLLGAGAELTTPNQEDYLPLNLAVVYSDAEMVSYLLSKGAPIESKRISSGVTALQQAPVYGKTDVLKLLISKGANVNAADKYGNTALHYAIEKNRLEDVKALVEAGAKLTTPNQDGYLPLNLAVMYSNAEMVSYLLSKGAPIESKRVSSGVTALQQAPVYGKTAILKVLISKGANVNTADKYGNTVLHYAIEKNSLADVKAIVEAGAKLTTPNQDGYLPLNLAVMYSNAEMVSYLLSKGAPIESKRISSGVTALQQAPVYGKTDVLKLLISKGANVNAVDKSGNTALHYAIEKNRLEDVKALVEAGANPKEETVEEILKPLFKYKWVSSIPNASNNPSINPLCYEITTGDNWSPLHVAVHHGSVKLTDYLLSHGYWVNKITCGYRTGSWPSQVSLRKGGDASDKKKCIELINKSPPQDFLSHAIIQTIINNNGQGIYFPDYTSSLAIKKTLESGKVYISQPSSSVTEYKSESTDKSCTSLCSMTSDKDNIRQIPGTDICYKETTRSMLCNDGKKHEYRFARTFFSCNSSSSSSSGGGGGYSVSSSGGSVSLSSGGSVSWGGFRN